MGKPAFLFILLILLFLISGRAQPGDAQIKVYDFDDGLSHRNVFKIAQDTAGFIWIATINGLDRFDGYEFIHYHRRGPVHRLPHDAISDMLIDERSRIWLGHPDFVTTLQPARNTFSTIKIKEGPVVQRESRVPHNLLRSPAGDVWMATYDEKTAGTRLEVIRNDSLHGTGLSVEGKYARRPMAWLEDCLYVGAFENQLWQLGPDGALLEQFILPAGEGRRSDYRITDLQRVGDRLWILLSNGLLYRYDPATDAFDLHPVSAHTRSKGPATTFLQEENGDIWMGGQGILWHYDARSDRLEDYDEPIRQIVKNTCTYRQIFQDRSGVIWVASNFGAVKIAHSDDLFTQYLSGGSEYCSNIYCSTRGITEDEEGRIYISHYNSIHVLEPETHTVSPLFPANDYFNYPFGLTHHRGALYTGNGRRIDLATLRVDTIFDQPSIDLGDVIADADGELWFGYRHWLYRYDPEREALREFKDKAGRWDTLDGTISCLYQGRTARQIWVGTLENGLYQLDKQEGRVRHYSTAHNSPARLQHDQINAIYEDAGGRLWLATGAGLHCLELSTRELRVYTTEDGLPNNFINGLLPEGDSCLWVSTDNGLCRFSTRREACLNFFQKDGISANEFNRISFYKARNGRMYFGGLNGVNAFFPDQRFLEEKEEIMEAPFLLTGFTKLDGDSDSLQSRSYGLNGAEAFVLSHRDKIFGFSFALADYRQPSENVYSYKLEGYEKEWSPPASVHFVRYNNIPAGRYTFRVRARPGKNVWNEEQLAVPVIIRQAYYKTWWFWLLCGLIGAGLIYGFIWYRIYTIRQREQALEALVRERTRELEHEKHKSEELLLNILPAEMAEELKKHGSARAKRHELVTVMFSDFEGFTKISERIDPEVLVAEIDYCFRAFDRITDRHGLEKIKTIGDAYMCMCIENGQEGYSGAVRMIQAALEIQAFMDRTAGERKRDGGLFFETRIGIHTGPVVAGIVGIKKFAYDIWGDTVNIASRMETYGEVGRVNISATTLELVQHHFNCQYHGAYAENEGESVGMYFVQGLAKPAKSEASGDE